MLTLELGWEAWASILPAGQAPLRKIDVTRRPRRSHATELVESNGTGSLTEAILRLRTNVELQA